MRTESKQQMSLLYKDTVATCQMSLTEQMDNGLKLLSLNKLFRTRKLPKAISSGSK
jgi:hypothetical protein